MSSWHLERLRRLRRLPPDQACIATLRAVSTSSSALRATPRPKSAPIASTKISFVISTNLSCRRLRGMGMWACYRG